jgi:hypothetical protein
MSYDGEYDASEYPDGIHAPRLGYRGHREMTELREAKDREIAALRAVIDNLESWLIDLTGDHTWASTILGRILDGQSYDPSWMACGSDR